MQTTLPLLTGVVHPNSSTKGIYSCYGVFSNLTPAAATNLVRECTTPSSLVLGAPVRSTSSSNRPTSLLYFFSVWGRKAESRTVQLIRTRNISGTSALSQSSKMVQLEN